MTKIRSAVLLIVLFLIPTRPEEGAIEAFDHLLPFDQVSFPGHTRDLLLRHICYTGRSFRFATVLIVAFDAVSAFRFDREDSGD